MLAAGSPLLAQKIGLRDSEIDHTHLTLSLEDDLM